MKKTMAAVLGLSAALAGASFAGPQPGSGRPAAKLESFPDLAGAVETLSTAGRINRRSAFFQSLGTNGRTCGTCHVPDQAFSLSAAAANLTFRRTRGQDPLFAPVDGANCPDVRRSDAAAHSLLLQHGLFRISIPLPVKSEFTISVVHDPYGCAITLDPKTGQWDISVYRRPLPATNLAFLSAVMIDGRETVAPLGDGTTFLANLQTDLKHQALDATTGHAQALTPPNDAQLAEIVTFELGLYTAQSFDWRAGWLTGGGADGGARRLAGQEYFPGINDSLGSNPTGAPFDPSSMTLFGAWADETVAATPAGARRDAARHCGRRRDLRHRSAHHHERARTQRQSGTRPPGQHRRALLDLSRCAERRRSLARGAPRHRDLSQCPAEHGERLAGCRRARRAQHAQPACVPHQRLSRSGRSDTRRPVLHERSRPSADHRQVQ